MFVGLLPTRRGVACPGEARGRAPGAVPVCGAGGQRDGSAPGSEPRVAAIVEYSPG